MVITQAAVTATAGMPQVRIMRGPRPDLRPIIQLWPSLAVRTAAAKALTWALALHQESIRPDGPTRFAWGYRHPGGRQLDQPRLSGPDHGRVDNTFLRLTRCSDGMLKNPVRRNARR